MLADQKENIILLYITSDNLLTMQWRQSDLQTGGSWVQA